MSAADVRLLAVGINYRSCPVELRELLACRAEELPEVLRAVAGAASEVVILTTCNRVELYAAGHPSFAGLGAFSVGAQPAQAEAVLAALCAARGIPVEPFREHMYVYTGAAAVRHLFAVAAGIESLVVGEPEILGQVRAAYDTACSVGCAGRVLHRLFQQALGVGKRARTETGIARSGASIGSAAVELAKYFGARVVATASSAEKRGFALDQGAEEAYAYDDFAERVRADVVIDPVGGDLVAQSLKVLEPLGVHVLIGYAGGFWQDLSPALLVGRNVALAGFYLGRLMRHRPELVQQATRELLALWEQGAVRPVVGATFPLEQAASAHRLIEERKHVGKVVLLP